MPDSSALVPRAAAPSLSVSSLLTFPKRRPKTATVVLLWLVGLYCAFLAKPPPPTEQQTAAFKQKITEVWTGATCLDSLQLLTPASNSDPDCSAAG